MTVPRWPAVLQRVTPCVPTFRLFGIKCAKCNMGFCSSDLVMRARGDVYHMECFRCSVCSTHLLPGDEFSVRDGELLCRADHSLLVERASAGSPLSPGNIHSSRQLRISGEAPRVGLWSYKHQQQLWLYLLYFIFIIVAFLFPTFTDRFMCFNVSS